VRYETDRDLKSQNRTWVRTTTRSATLFKKNQHVPVQVLLLIYLTTVGNVGALLWHIHYVIGSAHAGQAVRDGLLPGPCGLVHTVDKFPAIKGKNLSNNVSESPSN
jgi:hypothetical protein